MKIIFPLIISCIVALHGCVEVPDGIERDNIFDPKAQFDDEPPLAAFTVSPKEGNTWRTTFTFDASGSMEKEHPEALLYYRWDFNGDGVWDTKYSLKKKIRFNYQYVFDILCGPVTVYMEAFGARGLTAIDSQSIYLYFYPEAEFDWKIDLDRPDYIYFDASLSTNCDPEDKYLLYRWDTNNDGEWDRGYSENPLLEMEFPNSAFWTVKLQVKNRYGLESTIVKQFPIYDVLADNKLVAFYSFDGNANNMIGDSLHGTVHGASLTENRFGKPNSAYYFDGVDDYIDMGSNIALKPQKYFTISFWFKAEALDQPLLTSNYMENEDRYGFYFYVDKYGMINFYIYKYSSTAPHYDSPRLVPDKWYHIVGVKGDIYSHVSIYGSKYDTYAREGGIQYKSRGSDAFNIGRVKGKYFKGIIDDVIIINRVLSVKETDVLYHLRN